MQLAELTVRGFADLLGSDAPAPGGGSAAALAGALGAALTAMVGSLTVGRKKYAEFDGLARETLEKARDLEHRFLDVMERDTEAFNAVSAVQGAWLNVLINLGSVRDAAFAAQYRTRGQILLDEALPLAQSIYDRVLKAVQG